MTEKVSKRRIWMVRAGAGAYLLDEFIKNSIVAIGWNDLESLSEEISYNQLKTNLMNCYPDWSKGRIYQSAGQVWKFLKEFQPGHIVVTYDSSAREYWIGEIKSEYLFNKEKFTHAHYREVEWRPNTVSRDLLDVDSKNTLGSTLTIFEINEKVWEDLETANSKSKEEQITAIREKRLAQLLDVEDEITEDVIEFELLTQDVFTKSLEFIKDSIAALGWDDVERLVAALLRAMGYQTRFTSKGRDLGSDIIASPDVLALEEPRIKVEVKHRSKDKVSAPMLREFIGGLRDYNKGIYVTTSGFSHDAKIEAERANFPLTLIDSDWLVELLVNNYEKLDADIQALIPLKRIYWPAK